VDLSVQLAPRNSRSLLLSNPVMTASGTFGYGNEYIDLLDIQRLGAIVCKGTTIEPREGNPQPRITETASGILNAIGFQNIGIDALIKDKAPVWATWKVPVIVNITANTIEQFGQLATLLNDVKGVSGLEVNISCPNLTRGGMEFGLEPESAAQVTDIAAAVAEAGADALTLINTLKGMAIDIYTRKPVLGNVTGGLSGPAIKPVALRMVYDVAGHVQIPIIGSGGIFSGSDAIEFIMAGAAAVQVGSASFANPRASLDILEGISAYMQRENINKISDLAGIARK
jgi:dihydroorotate dehydrogenase (NAD+) catalytic subunit